MIDYKYIGSPYCRAEMYAGRVECCSLVNDGVYADGTDRRTDRRTPERYITLSTRRAQRNTVTTNVVGTLDSIERVR